MGSGANVVLNTLEKMARPMPGNQFIKRRFYSSELPGLLWARLDTHCCCNVPLGGG